MSMKSYEDSAEERERPLFWENHEALWETHRKHTGQEASPWRPLEKMGGSESGGNHGSKQHPPFPGRAGWRLWEWGAEGQREVFGGLGADS